MKPISISVDENYAYLSTFSGIYFVVDILDKTKPKILTILEVWTYTFQFLVDWKLAVIIRSSKYQLFDVTQMLMDSDLVSPTFDENYSPITLKEFTFAGQRIEATEIYFDETNEQLTLIQNQPTPAIYLYNTSTNLLEPHFSKKYSIALN